jgi:hypothetical protein
MTVASRILVAGMFVTSLVAGSAAHAVVGGVPDDGTLRPIRYPFVGSIVSFEGDQAVPFQWIRWSDPKGFLRGSGAIASAIGERSTTSCNSFAQHSLPLCAFA